MKKSSSDAGFSLMEILVSLAVIAILAVLLLQTLGKSVQRSKQVQCVNNLRQVGLAYHAYANEHNGEFPKNTNPSTVIPDPTEMSIIGSYGHGYAPAILLAQKYIPDLAMFFCPNQERYTYPDDTTVYGQRGWAKEGYYIGYTHLHLRDYSSGGGTGFSNYRNARVTDDARVPLLMDISTHVPALHEDIINVLYLGGNVAQVSLEKIQSLRNWPQKIEYMMRPDKTDE